MKHLISPLFFRLKLQFLLKQQRTDPDFGRFLGSAGAADHNLAQMFI